MDGYKTKISGLKHAIIVIIINYCTPDNKVHDLKPDRPEVQLAAAVDYHYN